MTYKLLIAYDGGSFGGWQKQPRGKPTIQGCLEAALSQILNSPISVTGSGRTDAGVHALGQVAHFKTLKDTQKINLQRALNSLTPPEIVIHNIWEAPLEFHALHSTTSKTYKYLILNHKFPSAFRHKYSTWVNQPLDLKKLNSLSQVFVGKHDFASFQTTGTEVSSTIRQITNAQWTYEKESIVEFTITANGFLKQMVRNIVGTLLDSHRRGASEIDLKAILAARDRRKAFGTAPSQGLYLYRVEYSQALDNKCRKI